MQEETPQGQPSQTGWQYNPEGGSGSTSQAAPAEHAGGAVSWTASEFITHEKDGGWYIVLGLIAVIAAVVAYLLIGDKITSAMIIVVALCLGVFSTRKPRTLSYQVDDSGIHVGDKYYGYDEFKSFSVIQEGGIRSIMLIPMKRFMPALSIYMDPADEAKIVEVLSDYLPLEERKQDAIDRLMHRIRF